MVDWAPIANSGDAEEISKRIREAADRSGGGPPSAVPSITACSGSPAVPSSPPPGHRRIRRRHQQQRPRRDAGTRRRCCPRLDDQRPRYPHRNTLTEQSRPHPPTRRPDGLLPEQRRGRTRCIRHGGAGLRSSDSSSFPSSSRRSHRRCRLAGDRDQTISRRIRGGSPGPVP